MLVTCPACQLEVLGDPPDRCPRCDAALVIFEGEASATDVALSPGAEDAGIVAESAPLPEPGFWWAVLVLFLTLAFAAAVGYIQRGILFTWLPRTPEGYDIATSLGFLPVALVSLAVAWLCLQPHPLQTLAPQRVRFLHVFIAVTAAIAFQFTCSGFEAIFTRDRELLPSLLDTLFRWIDKEQHYYAYQTLARQPWLAVILIGCVAPAICEEVFFRGYIGRGFVARYGAAKGVLLTSLLFGLMHIEPWHVLNTFATGLLFHTLYLASKSIVASMSAHFTINLMAYALMKLQQNGTLSYSFSETISEPLVTGAAACYLAASLCLLWRTRSNRQPSDVASSAIEPAAQMTPPVPQGTRIGLAGALTWSAVAVSGLCFISAFANAARPEWAVLSVRPMIAAGYQAYDNKQDVEALELFTNATDVAPLSGEAWLGRSLANYNLREYETALRDADRACELLPEYPFAQAMRAAALFEMGRPTEALGPARAAYLHQSNEPFIASVYCRVAWLNGEYKDAIRTATTAAESNPNDPFFSIFLSDIYLYCPDMNLRNEDAGMRLAVYACRITKNQEAQALVQLASAHVAQDDFETAQQRLDEAAALGNEPTHRYAKRLSTDLREHGHRLRRARAKWVGLIVDDLFVYKHVRKVLVVVPQIDLADARRRAKGMPLIADYGHEVVTQQELMERLMHTRNLLRKHAQLSAGDAELTAWFVAPTVPDLLAIDDDTLAEEMQLPLPSVRALKDDLRDVK